MMTDAEGLCKYQTGLASCTEKKWVNPISLRSSSNIRCLSNELQVRMREITGKRIMASQTQTVSELLCSHEHHFVGKGTKSDVVWSAPGTANDL